MFFGIVMILLIVVLIESLQKRVDDSYSQDIEKKHKELIDMYQGNPLVVRELKARTETMIHSGMKEYQNIEYQPKGIKEVTTPEERAARRKAQLAGKKSDYGEVHSRSYDHARFGRDFTDNPLIPSFDQDSRLVLLGHSFGGATIRLFAHLMAHGDEAERDSLLEPRLKDNV